MKSVHLRTSSPPTMVWAVLRKLLNLIYIWFFFLHFRRPPLWKMVRRTSCRGVHFLPSNKQVCKKKSPNKEFNSNIWFSTCSFSSEKQLQRDSLCDSNFLKNTFEWIKELILQLNTSLSFTLAKKYNLFEILLRILVQNLRTHLGIYFSKVFYMTKKTCFFLFGYCWMYLLLNRSSHRKFSVRIAVPENSCWVNVPAVYLVKILEKFLWRVSFV